MIRDAKLILCDQDVVTSITTITLVGDVVDLGADGKDAFGTALNPNVGLGGNNYLTVICDGTDFADSGTPTMEIALVTSDSATLASGNVKLAAKSDVDKTPNSGDIIFTCSIPSQAMLRYLGIMVTADSAMDAGAISAWLGPAPETYIAPTNLKK